MSLKGVTLSRSPAAVSRAWIWKVWSGQARVRLETTSSVCASARADLRVPMSKVVLVVVVVVVVAEAGVGAGTGVEEEEKGGRAAIFQGC